jgi:pimeloyl-ACP methyl ester carboxylesterase
VRWWHGDADPIVTFEDAKIAASRLPDAELILMPDESHLGGFAAAGDVLSFIRSHL